MFTHLWAIAQYSRQNTEEGGGEEGRGGHPLPEHTGKSKGVGGGGENGQ